MITAARLERWGAPVLCALLLGLALVNGLRPVRGGDWPWMYDALRDVGMAQVILDGRYPADNLYPSETLWINPLTAAVVAADARLAGVPAARASVELGPWVNLLAATAFLLLAVWWLGRWGGAAALAGYLIWNAQSPVYAYATYTPWLYAPHLAQGLFCAALLTYGVARARGGWWWFVLAGFLHGLTFLAHTAPALILGCIVCAMTAFDFTRPDTRRESAGRLAVLLAMAFLVSLPYTLPILSRYHFQVVNRFPAGNVQTPMRAEELGSVLLGALNLGNALAAIGLARMMTGPRDGGRRQLTIAWLLVLAAWLAQVYLWQWSRVLMLNLPQFVPAHHFHTAVTLFRALCLGAGVMALRDGLASALRWNERGWSRPVACACAVLLVVLPCLPAYLRWEEFHLNARERAEYRDLWEQRAAAMRWIGERIQPGETILCDDQLALIGPAPTAFGAVSTMMIFSGPYVDAARRIADRDRMWDALRAKDYAAFALLANKYNARFILSRDMDDQVVQASGLGVAEQMVIAPLTVYRLK